MGRSDLLVGPHVGRLILQRLMHLRGYPSGHFRPPRYRALSSYACNPLQHWWPICVHSPEIPFEIAPYPPG